jgi:hypothetical protein
MTPKENIKAKLTFEYDGKIICTWNLEFPKGKDIESNFKGIEMGYYNGTLLQAIAKEFNKKEIVEL